MGFLFIHFGFLSVFLPIKGTYDSGSLCRHCFNLHLDFGYYVHAFYAKSDMERILQILWNSGWYKYPFKWK